MKLLSGGKANLKYEHPACKKYATTCKNCEAIVEYKIGDVDESFSSSFFSRKVTERYLPNCPWCHKKIVLWSDM
jgi:hypothetical protein